MGACPPQDVEGRGGTPVPCLRHWPGGHIPCSAPREGVSTPSRALGWGAFLDGRALLFGRLVNGTSFKDVHKLLVRRLECDGEADYG